jgi:predicted nuclease of predicted toxin-antitoxin system
MKAKLDENLPLQIATRLRELGHDVHTAEQENLSGCGDSELWAHAQQEGRTLITQDLDFSDSRRFTPGTHHCVVLVRLHSPSRLRLVERLEEVFQGEAVNEWAGCFVVVTDQKIRVRRTPNRRT